MKVAVTGASGHIGYSIVQELLSRGITPKILIHRNNPFSNNQKVEYVKGSMLSKDDILNLVDGCDYIIHCAAMVSIGGDKEGDVYGANTQGVRNVLEAAKEKNIKRVVHMSSVHVFNIGKGDKILTEETDFIPDDTALIYEKSKRDAQIIAQEFAKEGLDVVILNPTSVFGAPDYANSRQNHAVWDLYHGKYPFLFKGGYDWVDVKDVAQASANALTMGRSGESYLLSGYYLTIKDLSQTVAKVTGKKITCIELPVPLVRLGVPFVQLYSKIVGTEPLLSHDAIDILLNSPKQIRKTKAANELNFTNRPIEETVAGIIEFFKSHKA